MAMAPCRMESGAGSPNTSAVKCGNRRRRWNTAPRRASRLTTAPAVADQRHSLPHAAGAASPRPAQVQPRSKAEDRCTVVPYVTTDCISILHNRTDSRPLRGPAQTETRIFRGLVTAVFGILASMVSMHSARA